MDQYSAQADIDLVKIASIIPKNLLDLNQKYEKQNLEKVGASGFAFPEARLFPIHKPEEAKASYAYFLHNLEKISTCVADPEIIESRLLCSLVGHGLEKEATELQKSFAGREELSKNASYHDIDNYLSDSISEIFSERSTVSIHYLQKEAETLEKNLKLMSTREAKQASLALMKSAVLAKFSTEKYPTIEAYAGIRGTDLIKVAEYMSFRAKRAKSPILKKAMARLAQAILLTNEHELDLDKVAEFIDTFDKATGTIRLVRRGSIPDGHNSVYNRSLIEKSAGVNLAGHEFSEEQLKALPVEKWEKALGEDFVKSATSGGEFNYSQAIDIASTLPLPEAKALSLYLEGN